jgi:hypothetical protein
VPAANVIRTINEMHQQRATRSTFPADQYNSEQVCVLCQYSSGRTIGCNVLEYRTTVVLLNMRFSFESAYMLRAQEIVFCITTTFIWANLRTWLADDCSLLGF